MRALIVVESAFGNTASIAEAIASALTGKGAEANVAPADRASGMRGVGAPSPGARPPRAHPAQRVRGHARTP